MFQPNMFEDRVHPVHFVGVNAKGEVKQGDLMQTELELAIAERIAEVPCPSAPFYVWFDGKVWQKHAYILK